MMRYALVVVLGITIAASSPRGAGAAGDADSGTENAAPAAEVVAAPGGGEMVILGPESRYVTRAWRDAAGRVRAGCARDTGKANEQSVAPERR